MVRRFSVLARLCVALFLARSGAPVLAATEPTLAQLQALAGEYTDPIEPDAPLSFYVENGKLIEESDRLVPTELTAISATDFSLPASKTTVRFALDPQGVIRSDNKTPFSRANCSNVIGIKDPVKHCGQYTVFYTQHRT